MEVILVPPSSESTSYPLIPLTVHAQASTSFRLFPNHLIRALVSTSATQSVPDPIIYLNKQMSFALSSVPSVAWQMHLQTSSRLCVPPSWLLSVSVFRKTSRRPSCTMNDTRSYIANPNMRDSASCSYAQSINHPTRRHPPVKGDARLDPNRY